MPFIATLFGITMRADAQSASSSSKRSPTPVVCAQPDRDLSFRSQPFTELTVGTFDLYVQTSHAAAITRTVFSEDGRFMASADVDGAIHLWDVASSAEYGLVSSGEQISALALSSQQHLLLAGTRKCEVIVWDTRQQRERGRFGVRGGEVRGLHLDPDHSELVVVADRLLTVWSLKSQHMIRTQEIPDWTGSALSPDGSTLALATATALLLVDTAGHRETISIERVVGAARDPPSVAWDAQGQVAFEQYAGRFDLTRTITAEGVTWQNKGCSLPPLSPLEPERIAKDALRGMGSYRTGPRRYFSSTRGIVAVASVRIYGQDERLVAYNISTCRLIRELQTDGKRTFGARPEIATVSVSPDGETLAYGMDSDVFLSVKPATIAKTPRDLQDVNEGLLAGNSRMVRDAMLIADNQLLLNNDDGKVSMVDLRPDSPASSFITTVDLDGEHRVETKLRAPVGRPGEAELVVFGYKGETGVVRAFVEGWHDDFRIERYALPSGKRLSQCAVNGRPIDDAWRTAFSENASVVAVADRDDAVAVFSIDSCRKLWKMEGGTTPLSMAVSDDGLVLLRQYSDGEVDYVIRPRRRGTVTPPEGSGPVRAIAVAGDGKAFAVAYSGGQVVVWNIAAQNVALDQIYEWRGSPLMRVQFLGARRLAASNDNGELRIWSRDDLGSAVTYDHAAGAVSEVSEMSDLGMLVGVTSRNAVALWRAPKAGAPVLSNPPMLVLKQLARKGWVAASPSGAFDAGDLDQPLGLTFRNPMRDGTVPIEAFYRDGLEPRIGSRLLAGETPRVVSRPSNLNLVPPVVKFVSVEPYGSQAGARANSVRVTLEVSGARRDQRVGDHVEKHATGAYDVRLFRDGQLVAQFPRESDEAVPPGETPEQELARWHRTRQVASDDEVPRTIVFDDVQMPSSNPRVQFSAYAFNVNRIKSSAVSVKPDLPPRAKSPRRAYIITVGVNEFSDKAWKLSYAVNDAVESGRMLEERMNDIVDEVVWVSLVSDAPADGAAVPTLLATKARIRAAIRLLAGDSVDPAMLAGIRNADRLRRAAPDDMVFVILSTHGLVDGAGRFYLLPSDIGVGLKSPALLEHAISSDDLATWLRDVDARDIAMIVDACHAEAGVQQGDFKPAPLGNRGLGQLAYDKRIRVLVASRKDQYARETSNTKLGLLMYALFNDGLREFRADISPSNGRITLAEWMGYAVRRVPELYKELAGGQFQIRGGDYVPPADGDAGVAQRLLQQPVLFDFTPDRDVEIASRAPAAR